ncbi:MAG: hypothetical protein E6Q33_00860 [Neisseriales bacterium]|nr:MAG: hypothetical protein E6Q33_00860 [Neisseriales bacterium]
MKKILFILSFISIIVHAEDVRANLAQNCPNLTQSYDACNKNLSCQNKVVIECSSQMTKVNKD